MADELFARVTKGLTDCIQSIEEAECPDDCPYNGKCWDESPEHQVNPMYLDLMKDAQDLIRRQEMELIRLRDQAQCVTLKTAQNILIPSNVLNGTERPDWQDHINETYAHREIKENLIDACEKLGLIAYERDATEVGGSGPMVRITATLRVHKPETAERMAT